MSVNEDFEKIRKIRGRLSSAKDDALLNMSTTAMSFVKRILRSSKSSTQTAAYHIIARNYEELDSAINSLTESMQFLDESKGSIKRDWKVLRATDADNVRGALFALLSSCESLDGDSVAKRVKSESQTLGRIMNEIEKIKNKAPKSCEAFARQSIEFELSLRVIDGILGGTVYPASEFDAYSKFSGDREDLGERVMWLNDSLRFFEDEYTKEDWRYFMELDSERLMVALKTAYGSSVRLVETIPPSLSAQKA